MNNKIMSNNKMMNNNKMMSNNKIMSNNKMNNKMNNKIMNKITTIKALLILFGMSLLLHSCSTSTPRVDYRALAKASTLLKIDINRNDNHKLYIEASQWVGVPYRSGGSSKQGTDCSGMVHQIYKKVYRVSMPRSSEEMKRRSRKVSKSKLQAGDLVFFSSTRHPKRVAHVGIYLKDNKFIHASTTKGVIISSLKEDYYKKHWMQGGRIH